MDLGGGVAMPMVGFGTWQMQGQIAYEAVRHALQVGYRHIDTATMYRNEEQVGRAIADSGLDRAEVFVTTKLPPGNAGRVRATIAESLKRCAPITWTCGWCTGRPAAGTWCRCGRTSWRSGTRA